MGNDISASAIAGTRQRLTTANQRFPALDAAWSRRICASAADACKKFLRCLGGAQFWQSGAGISAEYLSTIAVDNYV
jgi:hypothetical protein